MTSSPSKLSEFIKSLARVPRLVVLDIDYTIWPLHVDCYVDPPFKSDGNGGATDRRGTKIRLFSDVKEIMSELDSVEIKIAAASSTTDPSASIALQKTLGVYDLFHFRELYPRRKFEHFKRISRDSGTEYKDMLFFDDEHGNIRDISSLGVTCYYIEDDQGITLPRLKEGLQQFSRNSV